MNTCNQFPNKILIPLVDLASTKMATVRASTARITSFFATIFLKETQLFTNYHTKYHKSSTKSTDIKANRSDVFTK